MANSRHLVLPSLVVTAALLLGGLAAPVAAAPCDQKPVQLPWDPAGLVERVLAFVLGEEENSPDAAPPAEPSPAEEGSTPQLTDTSTSEISPAMDPDG